MVQPGKEQQLEKALAALKASANEPRTEADHADLPEVELPSEPLDVVAMFVPRQRTGA